MDCAAAVGARLVGGVSEDGGSENVAASPRQPVSTHDIGNRLVGVSTVVERHVGDVAAVVGLIGSPAVECTYRPDRPYSHGIRVGLGAVIVRHEDRILHPSFLGVVDAVGRRDDHALGRGTENRGGAVGVVRGVAVEEQLPLGPGGRCRSPISNRGDGLSHCGRIRGTGAVTIVAVGHRPFLSRVVSSRRIQGLGGSHTLMRPVIQNVLVRCMVHCGRRQLIGNRLCAPTEAGGRGHCHRSSLRSPCRHRLSAMSRRGDQGQWDHSCHRQHEYCSSSHRSAQSSSSLHWFAPDVT